MDNKNRSTYQNGKYSLSCVGILDLEVVALLMASIDIVVLLDCRTVSVPSRSLSRTPCAPASRRDLTIGVGVVNYVLTFKRT